MRTFVVATCLIIAGCDSELAQNQVFEGTKLDCPSPAVAQFEPWGKAGTQQICKIKHGPFEAWESGYLHLKGEYENGKEAGVWIWYGKDGNVERTVDYSGR